MPKAHDRILEILTTSDESDDSIVITGIRWYRDRGKLADAQPMTIIATPGAASATGHETALGQNVPPFTHIRIVPTHQA